MLLLKLSEATAARRRVPIYLLDDTDGKTPETGITFSAGDIKVSKNGAAEANHAGTVTELAGGMYYYEATAAELDTVGFFTARFIKAGVRTFVVLVQVAAFDPYDAAGLGLSRIDAAITTRAVAGDAMDLVADAVDGAALAASAVTEIQAGLALSTQVDALEADTTTLLGRLTSGRATNLDNLDATVSSRLASASYTASPTEAVIADKVLGRSLAGAADGGRTVRDALRALRNRQAIVAGTLTVYEENDTAAAWTAAVTTAAGNPITEVDPAA